MVMREMPEQKAGPGQLFESSRGRESESTLMLVRKLMDDVARLFRQEAALATAEVSAALGRFTRGVLSMLAGGAIVLVGILVLVAAGVLGLATVLAPWLAALIVGAVMTAIGAILTVVAARASDPAMLKPERSARSLQRDKAILTERER